MPTVEPFSAQLRRAHHSYGLDLVQHLFPNQSTEGAAVCTARALVHALTTKTSIALWRI